MDENDDLSNVEQGKGVNKPAAKKAKVVVSCAEF